LSALGDQRRQQEKQVEQRVELERQDVWQFSQTEVEAVNNWIDFLVPPASNTDKQVYYDFTGRQFMVFPQILKQARGIDQYYPLFQTQKSPRSISQSFQANYWNQANLLLQFESLELPLINMDRFLPLWFASGCLLESFVNVPATVSTSVGAAIIKILRAQFGFDLEGPGVAGTDELRRTNEGKAIGLVEVGLEICQAQNLDMPKNLREILTLSDEEAEFARGLLELSMRPKANGGFLIGLTWAFMELHEVTARISTKRLSPATITALQGIAKRERDALMICLHETRLDEDYQTRIRIGCEAGRTRIMAILEKAK